MGFWPTLDQQKEGMESSGLPENWEYERPWLALGNGEFSTKNGPQMLELFEVSAKEGKSLVLNSYA